MSLPPFHWWRTVFFLIPAIAVYTIVLGTISLVASALRAQNFAHKCAQWWGRSILATTGVRMRVDGTFPTTSCIYVANHASIYDTPIVLGTIPRQLRLMAKSTLGYVPFIGWHLRWGGHVLVNRKNPGAGIFKRMQRMAKSGASLIVFPEGSRSPDGGLKKFKAGIFLLAIENRFPVVPISIIGSRVVMPRGRLMTCPADVTMIVHPPIPTAEMTRENARALAERVRAIIAAPVPGNVDARGSANPSA